MKQDEVEILEIKYKGVVWIPKSRVESLSSVRPAGKQNYFQKWVMKQEIGAVFSLEDFYNDYPKHKTEIRRRERLDKSISDLCIDEVLQQWHKKDEFRRLK